jgi:hypothetical protein
MTWIIWISSCLCLFASLTCISSEVKKYPQLGIRNPAHLSYEMLPVHFHCEIITLDPEKFMKGYGDSLLCLEIDDGLIKECVDLSSVELTFHDLSIGNHTASVYLQKNQEIIVEPTAPIVFEIVTKDEYDRRVLEEFKPSSSENKGNFFFFPREQTLFEWVASVADVLDPPSASPTSSIVELDGSILPSSDLKPETESFLLVIGVKTSLINGFPSRQAIRSTWAKHLPSDVKLFFIGCQLSSEYDNITAATEVLEAIEKEKQYYHGDLLTNELDCMDSYFHLVEKTTSFFSFLHDNHLTTSRTTTMTINTTTTSSSSSSSSSSNGSDNSSGNMTRKSIQYVMITDDDIYLRVDELTKGLRRTGPRQQFYAGQVWSKQFHRVIRPQRDRASKYYLSEKEYPMNELPPFAIGPHYLLSYDCVAFIAENKHRLRGVGTLEDVSIGLWLLSMQVHPEQIPQFQNLKNTNCQDQLISLADLSPLGIRAIQTNLNTGKSFCHGFFKGWIQANGNLKLPIKEKKQSQEVIPNVTSPLPSLSFSSSSLKATPTFEQHFSLVDGEQLSVSTTVQYNGKHHTFEYLPSIELFSEYVQRICSHFQLSNQQQFMRLLGETMIQVELPQVDISRLVLWKHNIQSVLNRLHVANSETQTKVIRVGYSPSAKYTRIILENLFASVFSNEQIIVVPVMEHQLNIRHNPNAQLVLQEPLDIFVFSVLDGGCGSDWNHHCQAMSQAYIQHFGASVKRLMMINGEAWDVSSLDERILLLSTNYQKEIVRQKYLYLPVAATSFGERLNTSPLVLFKPIENIIEPFLKTKFCAYLYARCDRPQREYMYDLLNAQVPVDALGACRGSSLPPDQSKLSGRVNDWYNDEAIDLFKAYKFVIAFENTQTPGYVTEKIVNAYLAGAIPIYLGHSNSVRDIFNPKSFIDCGQFSRLKDCVDLVLQIHQSKELYTQMLQQPPVLDREAFQKAFGWHPHAQTESYREHFAALLDFPTHTTK